MWIKGGQNHPLSPRCKTSARKLKVKHFESAPSLSGNKHIFNLTRRNWTSELSATVCWSGGTQVPMNWLAGWLTNWKMLSNGKGDRLILNMKCISRSLNTQSKGELTVSPLPRAICQPEPTVRTVTKDQQQHSRFTPYTQNILWYRIYGASYEVWKANSTNIMTSVHDGLRYMIFHKSKWDITTFIGITCSGSDFVCNTRLQHIPHHWP